MLSTGLERLALTAAGCYCAHLPDRFTFGDDAGSDPVDAGTDSATLDAGAMDAGAMDAGAMDAASDAGLDAELTGDAGGDPDASLAPDAMSDAGPVCDVTATLCGVEQLCAGGAFACARTTAGFVYCWGTNTSGQLARPVGGFEVRPVRVETSGGPLRNVAQVACGEAHVCALDEEGDVYCWGHNAEGQLGDGTTTTRASPTRLASLDAVTVRALDAHVRNTCAVLATRQIRCWGDNFIGQLGTGVPLGERQLSPVDVANVYLVDELGIGAFHMCARSGPTVQCWGNNFSGQLGNGTRDNSSTPVNVMGISDAVSLAVGDIHNCVLRATGTVSCWGDNRELQLGSTSTGSLEPLPVPTRFVAGASWLRAYLRTCAGPAPYCWGGTNTYGELGGGAAGAVTEPVLAAVAPADTRELVPGLDFTCARRASGSVACWGRNDRGQLGDGTTVDRLSPETVVAP